MEQINSFFLIVDIGMRCFMTSYLMTSLWVTFFVAGRCGVCVCFTRKWPDFLQDFVTVLTVLSVRYRFSSQFENLFILPTTVISQVLTWYLNNKTHSVTQPHKITTQWWKLASFLDDFVFSQLFLKIRVFLLKINSLCGFLLFMWKVVVAFCFVVYEYILYQESEREYIWCIYIWFVSFVVK